MNSREGSAVRNCMTDLKSNEGLASAVRERLLVPRKRVIVDILRRGVPTWRGAGDALTDRVIELGPMLLHAERTQLCTALRDASVVAIVDEILMPLLRRVDVVSDLPRG